ncbi:MAG: hypothetical protein KAS32_09565, partial [Candidatus Peribacteraceae bacterium]|nr:hypothetical protein [Candidatus Peribacteraceae bacterium]
DKMDLESPLKVKEFPQIESIKDIENCLRDHGFSSHQRKILISKIKEFSFKAKSRDDTAENDIKSDNRDACGELVDVLKNFEVHRNADELIKILKKTLK